MFFFGCITSLHLFLNWRPYILLSNLKMYRKETKYFSYPNALLKNYIRISWAVVQIKMHRQAVPFFIIHVYYTEQANQWEHFETVVVLLRPHVFGGWRLLPFTIRGFDTKQSCLPIIAHAGSLTSDRTYYMRHHLQIKQSEDNCKY